MSSEATRDVDTSGTNQTEGTARGDRFLSFSLGGEEYAIPLLSVKEVIAVPEVTPIPFTPPHFLGIMNLRGQVISVIDLRQKLGIKPSSTAETSVIICDLSPICLGIVVDSINLVLSPNPSEVSDKPEIQSSRNTDYITSVYRKDKKLILFLDVRKTLDAADQQALNKTAKTTTKKAA